MSRTYKHTKGNNKRIQDSSRDMLFWNWEQERNKHIDYNDGADTEKAIKLRKGEGTYSFRKHCKWSRNYFRKQEKSNYKKNLKKGLDFDNWDELYLTYSKKVVDQYT